MYMHTRLQSRVSWVQVPSEAAHFSLKKRVVSGVNCVVLCCILLPFLLSHVFVHRVHVYTMQSVYVVQCVCVSNCVMYRYVYVHNTCIKAIVVFLYASLHTNHIVLTRLQM